MSYLVMECHPGYAVLLDEEGRFCKAANFHYEVGQTVYQPVLMKEKPETQRHAVRWISGGLAAIAACLLLFFGVSYYQAYMEPYSYIYLTINPEIQMDLNRQGMVVGLVGTNEDGETLLDGYDGKGKDKLTVADELIDRAIELGFLSEGGRVSFAIDSPDDALFQEYGMELRTGVTEHLDGRMDVTIEIVDYQNSQKEESPESSSSPASVPAASSEASQPVTSPESSSSATDYGDTDYGSSNSGTANKPAPSGGNPASEDTDYGSGSDGVTDHTPPASSKPASENSSQDGTTDYSDGNTDYDPGNSEDDDSDDRDDGDDQEEDSDDDE